MPLMYALCLMAKTCLFNLSYKQIIDNGGGMDWNAGIHQRSMFARAEIFASCAKFISG
jgi:hypothetical protein